MYSTAGGSIPIKELDASVVEMYINDMKKKCEATLLMFRFQYGPDKIKTLLLEGDNAAFTLLRYVTEAQTKNLVLGSCSSHYFTRKPKDSELPSVVLKHAPDTCNIYVVSANKIISNSLSPMLIAETNLISHGTSKQESSLSSSSTDSKYVTCLSDTQGFSYVNSSPVSKKSAQIAEDTISDTHKLSPGSEQAEIEQMHLKLENTVTMYNKACEDLARAQSEVQVLSSECIEEAQKVNATQQRVENHRKMAAIDKDKYLEAEKEIEMAKKGWPLAEAHELAEIALKCCKLRCRDRPDLETQVLPTLKRLAVFADSRNSADRSHLQVPKHFYCPILLEIMHNPHIAADGFTYEFEAIEAWLYRHDISPTTKERLEHKMLTPNHVLSSAIQEWRRQVESFQH
ncbi:U-box domain-containing protein 34 [Dorcoceras hygrometricum]|nr:U-box domain-containing protein 34 [Dorcoceras hygrometricum]